MESAPKHLHPLRWFKDNNDAEVDKDFRPKPVVDPAPPSDVLVDIAGDADLVGDGDGDTGRSVPPGGPESADGDSDTSEAAGDAQGPSEAVTAGGDDGQGEAEAGVMEHPSAVPLVPAQPAKD